MRLDEWQELVLQAAMGERTDGRWATPQVAVSAPRQNGKSQLIVARALAGILLFGEMTIIVSAHQQDTAREVFTKLVDILEAHPSLDARVEAYGRALNREYIRFNSGQVIRFKARSTGGGRGFSCDCLLLDEAQILSPPSWAAILPTMSARPNPQVWLLGTPPTQQDDGEVFERFRSAGIAGKESRLAYLEWSADPQDDFDDPETWAKANPAFGVRISHDAIAGERATMSDAQFALERLGMWEDARGRSVIPADSWIEQGDETSIAASRLALGIEVGPDMAWASVSLAGQRADGNWHIELDDRKDGTAWVVPYVKALLATNPNMRAVVADAGSPTKALFDEFALAKINLTSPTVVDLGQSCSRLLSGVVAGLIFHTKQPQLSVAASVAGKRALGDTGMWVWSRRTATSDITPIQSATLALHGAQSKNVKKPLRGNRSSSRRAVVM